MKRAHYPAVVDKDPDSDYGVVFPDFPGCVSVRSTLDEAVQGAHEALAGHVALMVADGDPLPEPTPLEHVAAQRDASTVAITLVPVTLPGQGAAREHHDGRGASGRNRSDRRQPLLSPSCAGSPRCSANTSSRGNRFPPVQLGQALVDERLGPG